MLRTMQPMQAGQMRMPMKTQTPQLLLKEPHKPKLLKLHKNKRNVAELLKWKQFEGDSENNEKNDKSDWISTDEDCVDYNGNEIH